ncbi:unnamed protein product [Moneuplotes crassus]|uniref:Uncharacterized protein n=1 Tax=Euplotes crassus TaxID=5936 RepID=A0AAD1XC76_EUPCR|nr:unnamed protein product [Moneuplotes crassus]
MRGFCALKCSCKIYILLTISKLKEQLFCMNKTFYKHYEHSMTNAHSWTPHNSLIMF